MAVRTIVMIETDLHMAFRVLKVIEGLRIKSGGRIAQLDNVTGPYDIILTLEAPTMADMSNIMFDQILNVEGIKKTNTCISLAQHDLSDSVPIRNEAFPKEEV